MAAAPDAPPAKPAGNPTKGKAASSTTGQAKNGPKNVVPKKGPVRVSRPPAMEKAPAAEEQVSESVPKRPPPQPRRVAAAASCQEGTGCGAGAACGSSSGSDGGSKERRKHVETADEGMCRYCLHLVHGMVTRQTPAVRASPPAFVQQQARGLFVVWKRLVSGGDEEGDKAQAFETVRATQLARPLEPLRIGLKLKAAVKAMADELAAEGALEGLHCEVLLMRDVARPRRWDDFKLGSEGLLLRARGGAQKMLLPSRLREHGWSKAEALLHLCGLLEVDASAVSADSSPQDIAEFLAARGMEVFKFGVSSACVAYSAAVASFEAARPRTLLSWRGVLVIGALLLGLLALRWGEEHYDVAYESFVENYGVLGLEEGAALQDVKRAYRRLSLTHHPDKVTNCDKVCEETWLKISKAHQQIVDYDRGVLNLVSKNTPSSSSSSSSSS
ncbi:MAG: AMMECR1 domain-containing protein, partial [archaeon]|nr:AMMECR1 domain-containing protein [archaeon]